VDLTVLLLKLPVSCSLVELRAAFQKRPKYAEVQVLGVVGTPRFGGRAKSF
jgi:hypothetical protein